MIDSAIVPNPPFTIREGGMIKQGYNQELDVVISDMTNSKDILAGIEADEREKNGYSKAQSRL